jgi:hypothetical protein
MVAAWLVEHGYLEDARRLIEQLAPYFQKLRFYPVPREKPRRFSSRLHVQNVGETLQSLQRIEPNERILAQKEAVEVWAPFHDRVVALFLETVENDWPCRRYPDDWAARAGALLDEYAELRKQHQLCGKPEQANGHSAQLRELLRRCAQNPQALSGREVGKIRLILHRYVEKRGIPNSPVWEAARGRQIAEVSKPTHHQLAGVVIARLEQHANEDGLDRVEHLKEAVRAEEAAQTGVSEGIPIPIAIQQKVERCLNETVEVLVERGLITSGEALARVLPQMTSGLRAAGIVDPTLRQLYAAIYRAFRRRRSLLLLNLEKQVQIEELPWVAAIDRFRSTRLSDRELARQTLEELVSITLTSFPHAILPNKLLQELRALVKGASLDIPLVDELAADIFMGRFSGKFIEAAKVAAAQLDGSLYATYYGIDFKEIQQFPEPREKRKFNWFRRPPRMDADPFAQLCAARAGVSLGTWDPTTHGMIIEQQQILTTQNLAALFAGLNLTQSLQNRLDEMAKQCFAWICRRHQMKVDRWHAQLIVLKNTAYAWRQMVFFLALLPENATADFLKWAEDHLMRQPEEFRKRFQPALKGLARAAEGYSPDSQEARRFLGWSRTGHWLLEGRQDR